MATAKAKAKIDPSRKIKAYANQHDHFYIKKSTGKYYPRGQAYEMLLKARNRTMVVGNFIEKIEKSTGVSKAQAVNIVQKLVGKPSDSGDKGAVCRFV